MARIARKNLDSSYFHVIVQGYEKQFIFSDKKLINKYLENLFGYKNNYKVNILAYCIMGNHAHILIHSPNIYDMSKFMQKVNSNYAVYYNKVMKRVGYVFRDRFLSEPIKNEHYLYNCLAYIHMNPVKAGIVEFPKDYRYSSYNDYSHKRGIVNDDILKLLFWNPNNYLEIFDFVHIGVDDCMEYKKDIKKLDYAEAFKVIQELIEKYCIDKSEIENKTILKFLKEKLNTLGVSLKQLEKYLNISHKKAIRILEN